MKKSEYKLKKELHIYFFKVLLLAGVIISVMFMTYYSVRETAVIAEGKYWRLAQSVTYADRIMEEVATIGDSIWTSSQIQGIKTANRNQRDYLYYRSCMDYLSNMEASANNIYRIRVFDLATKTLITSRNGVFYDVNEEAARYYQGQMDSIKNSAWIMDFSDGIVPQESDGEHFLYYVRPVYSIITGEKTGLVCIDVPKEVFSALMKQREAGDGFVIISETVEIPAMGLADNDVEYLKAANPQDSKFKFYLQHRSYTAVYQQSDYSGWHFYLYYLSTGISFDWGIFVIAVLLLCAILVTAYAMIVRIFRQRVEEPIEQLLQAMTDFEQGEFGVQVKGSSQDMFDEIFRHFNHMSLRTKELVNELIVERIRLKDGKLKMLQSQIKPHFLYNIFNSMIWMTEQKNYQGLEQMVYATAGYYKTSLNFGNDAINLFDNLNQLKYYARIQEIRFPAKFQCEIVFDEEILCDSIPNLLLQPLLENAIGHGAAGGKEQTQIRVSGYRHKGDLVFEIRDNGAGIEPERLRQIQEVLKQADLLLTDIRMPGMDGLTAIQYLKQQLPDLQCVVFTAYQEFEYAKKAIELGVNGFVTKPVLKPEVIGQVLNARDKLQSILEARQALESVQKTLNPVLMTPVERSLYYMKEKIDTPFTMTDVAEFMNMNPSYFSRYFKEEMGISFIEYVKQIKVERAKVLLTTSNKRIYEISSALGYSSVQYFSTLFKSITGVTPQEYKNRKG